MPLRKEIWIKGYSKRYDEDVAFSAIPKCGSTSLRDALDSRKNFTNSEILTISKRIAIIRHPQRKLFSGFYHYYKLNSKNKNGRQDEVPKSVTHNGDGSPNYEGYIDHLLLFDNVHWHPQTLLLGDTPNRYFRLDDISNVFNHFFEFHLQNENSSRQQMTTNYRAEELKIKYAPDIDLYRSIEKINSPMFAVPSKADPWW